MGDTGFRPFGYIVAALAVSLVLWFAYRAGVNAGRDEIRADWSAERVESARAKAEVLRLVREREQLLRVTIQQIKDEYHDKIQRIAAERDSLIRGLRDRPAARAGAGGVPTTAEAGTTGCTGEGLARGDAEFLVRYAADAAQLSTALGQCRSQYDSIRETLGEANSDEVR